MPKQAACIPVVIVEDEPVLREELAFQLGHLGFAVEAFESANQLYRHLATAHVPLVVLDIGLEGEDGLSVCQYLRSHDSRIGIVFNGKERFDVEEYCVSEGWVKVPPGKTLDRKGRPLLITLKGQVEAFYK